MVQYKELLITGWAVKSQCLKWSKSIYHFLRKRLKSAHSGSQQKQSENCRICTKIKCRESQKEKTSEKDCNVSSGFRRVIKRRHQKRIVMLAAAFGESEREGIR